MSSITTTFKNKFLAPAVEFLRLNSSYEITMVSAGVVGVASVLVFGFNILTLGIVVTSAILAGLIGSIFN